MLVDSHCHLDLLEYKKLKITLEEILEQAKAHDVEHILSVSVELERFDALLEQAMPYQQVSLSYGQHPTDDPGSVPNVESLCEQGQHSKVIALGETGLDYYRVSGNMDWQQTRFRHHIRAARELKKPLIIHTRQARDDTLKILKEERAFEVGGVFHCFTEDLDMALAGIDLGFMISFSGIVTFKNAKQLQEVALSLPIEQILVETDSPYLAPVPHRGKPNVPAFVQYTAKYLAQLKGVTYEKLAQQTTENFYQLFNNAKK